MTQSCIEAVSLTKRFGQKVALNDLSLTIPDHGIHAIVGSNGAGKSTLFRLLLGIDTPTSGHCRVMGTDSQALTERERGQVGYVNEEHTLPDWMTVEGVIRLQRSFYSEWKQDVFKRTVSYFDIDPKQKVSGLSRGERAGLSLSLALAQQPKLLILDEPTLGLDVVAKQSFLESLMFIGTEHQASIIYCSHQMDEIERVADNLILMERGTLINNSAPEDFVERVSAWSVDFNGQRVDITAIPGLLSSKSIDGRHHITVVDAQHGFDKHLETLGAQSVMPIAIGLESAVNAYLTRNHSKPTE